MRRPSKDERDHEAASWTVLDFNNTLGAYEFPCTSAIAGGRTGGTEHSDISNFGAPPRSINSSVNRRACSV